MASIWIIETPYRGEANPLALVQEITREIYGLIANVRWDREMSGTRLGARIRAVSGCPFDRFHRISLSEVPRIQSFPTLPDGTLPGYVEDPGRVLPLDSLSLRPIIWASHACVPPLLGAPTDDSHEELRKTGLDIHKEMIRVIANSYGVFCENPVNLVIGGYRISDGMQLGIQELLDTKAPLRILQYLPPIAQAL